MSFSSIAKGVGKILTRISFTFLIPVTIAIIYKEYSTIIPFVSIFGLSFLLGSMLMHFNKDSKDILQLREGLATITLLWLIVVILASIPYHWISSMSFLDAFFEAMSSWTTTGFSVMVPEITPHVLLFWRSIGQWFGGLGIVSLVVTVINNFGNVLYIAEGRDQKIKHNLTDTMKTIWKVYALYTILGIVALLIAGMPLFDAITHTMSAISTGGMSTHSNSAASFSSLAIRIILIVLMFLGNISFFSHNNLLKGKIKDFIADKQILALVILVAISTFFVGLHQGFFPALFQVTSAVGTGFQTENLTSWSSFSILFLIVIMIIGGSSGSTAGGIKLERFLVILKNIYNNIRSYLFPNRVFSKRIGAKIYTDVEITNTYKYVMLYLSLFIISTLILTFDNYTFPVAAFQVASAQGNVGLSLASDWSTLAKVVLIINMFAGRLEIWALFVFIGKIGSGFKK